MKIPILGVENVVAVPSVVGNTEPHLFEIWDAEYVGNISLIDPTFNGIKLSLLVSGRGA